MLWLQEEEPPPPQDLDHVLSVQMALSRRTRAEEYSSHVDNVCATTADATDFLVILTGPAAGSPLTAANVITDVWTDKGERDCKGVWRLMHTTVRCNGGESSRGFVYTDGWIYWW